MTTQPGIDAIAREAAEQIDMQIGAVRCDGSHPGPNSFSIIAAAIRRAQGESYPNLFQGLSRQIAELKSERDALATITKAADQLESLLSRNCGSNDDWPISLKVSGDYAQELAGKLTALTRALKPYRKAKNE